ncbi:MFS transporter [Haloplanus halophilus]|uniref:MFS transporter n=1 Tax=Haloplanus halophilus TaxID=2949993 RepID=UPI002040B54B|nr:MFS transporter [Haloplanus sp. GDY1]
MTRRLFGTLCGLVLCANFGRVAFAPLLETFRTTFQVGTGAVGLVATLVWVGSAVPRIPVGYLVTRIPRGRIVLGAGLLLTVASALTATTDSLPLLQVGAFAVGVASGAYYASAVPLIGDLYPDRVGQMAGVHGTAAQTAAVVAPTLTVALVAAESWRAVFWLLAAVGATFSLLFLVVSRRRDGGVPRGADHDFLAALAHWRVILAAVVMVGGAGFVWQGVFNFYVTYLVTTKGMVAGRAGTLLTVAFAAGLPAFWLGGSLADRLPHVPYILALGAGVAAGVAALTVAGSLPALVAVSVALGLVAHSLFPALDAYVLGTVPDNRGSAYAVYGGLALLVQATGSGAVGLLGEIYPFDAIFRGFALGLLALLALLAALYLRGAFPTAE